MVKLQIKYVFLVLVVFLSFSMQAQRHLITDVQLDKSSVYVGEPVKVSISIFTSTWFTSGVNPGNIKVNNAFTIYFRSLSSSKEINGQTYSGVTLYFNVFPYDDEDLIFPSLEFTVETPDKGGYKGVKRVVKTPQRTIKVKSVPPGFNKKEWLVTSNMTASDNWSGNMNEVRVGDVLERRISRNVAGTVSELVPPIVWDTIPNVSLYPTRSNVDSKKTKTSISATRTDGVRYLFEKEGEIVIPEKVLTWWNPRAQKLFKRTLKGYTINVKANPDLGILESMKDSLQVSVPVKSVGVEDEEPTTILGLSVKQFLILLICVIIGLYVLIKVGKRVYKKIKLKQAAFKVSEAYFFKEFLKEIPSHHSKDILNALYHWIDKLQLDEPTIEFFVSKYGDNLLGEDLKQLMISVNNESPSKLKLNTKAWIQARARFLNKTKTIKTNSTSDWVNP